MLFHHDSYLKQHGCRVPIKKEKLICHILRLSLIGIGTRSTNEASKTSRAIHFQDVFFRYEWGNERCIRYEERLMPWQGKTRK